MVGTRDNKDLAYVVGSLDLVSGKLVIDIWSCTASYSPELNPIERLWQLLRHRVTHNRLFETLSELTDALGRALGRALRALSRRKRQLLSLIMSQRKRAKSSTV